MLGSINLLQIILQAKSLFRKQKTCQDHDVMLLFREPGVTGEYRPSDRPFSYYFYSVFQVNNETVNVWTHIIAAVLFLYKTYYYIDILGWKHGESITFAAFGLCSAGYAIMSVIAHTCHSKSPQWHYRCFQLDYAGIGAYGLGMGILFFHTGCPEGVYAPLRRSFHFIQILPCWIFVICACIAKLKYRRPYPFQRKLWQIGSGSLQAVFGGLPILARLWNCFWDSECSMTSMAHHTSWFWPAGISVFFFSSHLPEKIFPGKFDVIGQGHQLFHVLITILTLQQFDAAYIDVIEYDMDNSRDRSVMFNNVRHRSEIYI